MANDNGGIIGIINTPTADTASGVWSLDSQYQAQTTGTWPPIPAIGLNSARFNSGSSDYLTRTASGGSNQIYTASCWVKRTKLGTTTSVLTTGNGSADNNARMLIFDADDKIEIAYYNAGFTYEVTTNRLFRDVSAWYHIVIAVDTTQVTASDRIKIYVNGVQETSFATSSYPSLNATFNYNSSAQYIGDLRGSGIYSDFYLSEFNYIDGQALDPTSFGAFNANGVWTPIPPTVSSYGTNGFRFKFENSANLGEDSSPNGNNFTVNNLTSVDQSGDYPVNNFSTMNAVSTYGTVALAEGNLQVNVVDSTDNATSTFMVSSGKWYWEGKYTSGSFGLAMVGIRPEGMNYNQQALFNLTGTYQGYYYYADNGNIRPANTSYGASYDVGDIIGFALDLDSGTQTITFYKNGVSQGAVTIAQSGLTWGFSYNSGGASDTFQMNFGHPPYAVASGNADANGYGNFEYTVPSGYYSLCTKNLAEFG
jgi:hypothetical protein